MTYDEWAKRWPEAAQELEQMHTAALNPADSENAGKSEAWAQQQIRIKVAKAGGAIWRNNVGATKAKEDHTCPRCSFKFEVAKPPLRYGLCNDSVKLNNQFKSADLIGIMPVLIKPEHVGRKIGMFISYEAKKPGWTYNPKDAHTAAQANWAALVGRFHGYATFSEGEL